MPITVNIYSLPLSFITYQQPTTITIIDHLNNKNIYIRKIIKELNKLYPHHIEIIKEIFNNNIKVHNITKNTSGFVDKIDVLI